ncbi:hypothetical protein [Pontibacter ramchanderi]|uniref:hypothetical protein n=1 Tax=Pontibacter ramchanderi TaxID=1179743 RepID=UPI00118048BB|nr:hypothetical protein [Pontibacter ramchanderi]
MRIRMVRGKKVWKKAVCCFPANKAGVWLRSLGWGIGFPMVKSEKKEWVRKRVQQQPGTTTAPGITKRKRMKGLATTAVTAHSHSRRYDRGKG